MEPRLIIADNLTKYRKANQLTQQELADKLNYTDKAVSKWERGEAIPDVLVLKQICDLYGIKVDDLLQEHVEPVTPPVAESTRRVNTRHLLIALLSCGLVWLVATIVVVITLLIDANIPISGYAFMWALPACIIVAVVFNVMWGGLPMTTVLVSLLVWSLCGAMHYTLKLPNSWLFYMIGAVLQVLIILWYLLQHFRKKRKKNKAAEE